MCEEEKKEKEEVDKYRSNYLIVLIFARSNIHRQFVNF